MNIRRHPAILCLAKFWLLRNAFRPIARRRRDTRKSDRPTVFIDLGAADGDTARLALRHFPNLERLFLFEPHPDQVALLRNAFGSDPRIEIIPAAAGTEERASVPLYRGTTFGSLGGSLLAHKRNVDAGRCDPVPMADFPRFLRDQADSGRQIILKIDIEGAEYDLLKALESEGAWSRVSKVFCEWHWERIGLSRSDHMNAVIRLQQHGYDLTGINRFDEFSQQMTNRTFWSLGLARPVFTG